MDIIDLLEKMNEFKTESKSKTTTERGTVESTISDEGVILSFTHELEEINWKDPDVERLVGIIEEIPFDSPYAKTYQENIRQAYVLHGRDGVKTQITYIKANTKDKRLIELLTFMHDKI